MKINAWRVALSDSITKFLPGILAAIAIFPFLLFFRLIEISNLIYFLGACILVFFSNAFLTYLPLRVYNWLNKKEQASEKLNAKKK